MGVQRCVYLDDDLSLIIKNKKLPLTWFVNQALREYFDKIGFLKELDDDRQR